MLLPIEVLPDNLLLQVACDLWNQSYSKAYSHSHIKLCSSIAISVKILMCKLPGYVTALSINGVVYPGFFAPTKVIGVHETT